jgi:hypothetical protein
MMITKSLRMLRMKTLGRTWRIGMLKKNVEQVRFYRFFLSVCTMAIPVVEFSSEGYRKLERFLAKNQLNSNEITKFWELE